MAEEGRTENGLPVPSIDVFLGYDPKVDKVLFEITWRDFISGDTDKVEEHTHRTVLPYYSFEKIALQITDFYNKVKPWHNTLKQIATAEATREAEMIIGRLGVKSEPDGVNDSNKDRAR